MQRVLRRGARLAALLLAAICLYTGLLLAAYAFPDEWISDNVGAAVNVLTEEGNMVGGVCQLFLAYGLQHHGQPDGYADLSGIAARRAKRDGRGDAHGLCAILGTATPWCCGR